ncbi:potassium transporter 4 isoform X1 [Neltuma alba]|uniref:potassium transporter 4 isoform X1 n=1 Tax=Neltuma alba TaxID=207710 RepID=UPI0010A4B174|nr:potassium transporter 4-like isoform X1 [Prosopis alba]XP_028761156.1 potassium transporter 4-like isoform X1 [Prosopis alba]
MDTEAGAPNHRNPPLLSWVNLSRNILLAYQSLGVVYGDLSTSPLYVYTNTMGEKSLMHLDEETIFGSFSLIFWTLTLIPLLKYVFILLSADDNSEGGTFALYTLLCRHGKFNLLPNQQAADEELSSYKHGPSSNAVFSSTLKRILEKHGWSRTVLLVVVLLGVSMLIGDGVLSPAMSILAALSGVRKQGTDFSEGVLVLLVCIILIGLFALQHVGTHRVAFMFAPILTIWLLCTFAVGLYNIIRWNTRAVFALSPHYMCKFFSKNGRNGWLSLGGILLCITGTEAMFADLGHFTAMSIRLAFTCAVYPCLVVQYMGQAAFLSKNLSAIDNSFYHSIPGPVYWPVFVIATLATVVGSQAVITATFSIINQCHALGCFPRVKVVHTSKDIFGRIYIPEINWILMLLTLAVTVGFRNTNLIGNAYGLAVVLVMFVTTFLMALVIIFVWEKSIFVAMAFLLFFWAIEGLYLSAVLVKVPQGGWVPLVLAFFFMTVMCIWHYGTHKKFSFETQNRASLKWLLGLGPSLGIVRVPGIGLIYSGLVTGIPTIFSHFVTNLPAFHKILVFVCIKSVPVPYVSTAERFLVGRVCPRPYRMYRCTVRYGYKDIQRNDEDFENLIIQNLAQFILMEAMEEDDSDFETSPLDGRMTVVSGERMPSSSSLIVSEHEDISVSTGRSASSRSLWSVNDENPPQKKKRVRYQVPNIPEMDPHVREELTDIIEAKEAGVAYIMGNTYVKARKSSSFLERFAIDVLYTFLRKNCRGPAVCLNIPHVSMIEVGMIYHV